ncbi:glycerophosphodiester phosphodiesterase family protein [Geoglobus acetivorans]|uniref:Glycerophosphoryl diester phosphodiesterase n=1 Tax=Geoglobus acetivorans TaxID=565033 RepID=A0A0A7GG94_GEOAI|nr:Glycerophosphoryl diester phosphodiesterase [Geoglobus acetivorans]
MLDLNFSPLPSALDVFKGLFLNIAVTAILVAAAWFKDELFRTLNILHTYGRYITDRKPMVLVWVDDGFLLAKLSSNLERELGDRFRVLPLESPEDVFRYPRNSRIIPAVLFTVTDVTKLSEDENKRVKIQEWLKKYVENGGGLIGGHDIIYRRTRNEILKKVFGGEMTEFHRTGVVRYVKNGDMGSHIIFRDLPDEFELEDGEIVWGNWDEDVAVLYRTPPPESLPLVTCRDYGRGKAIWINSCDRREGLKNSISSSNPYLIKLIRNAVLWVSQKSQARGDVPVVLAHRGYSAKYPENTIISFVEAVYAEADGVELDVWLSRDGVAFVFHDSTLEKVNGDSRKVKELTFDELKSVSLEMGQRIPSLEDVLNAIPKYVIVDIEIKDRDAVEEVMRIIDQHDHDRVLITSFDPQTLRDCRKMNGGIKLGLLRDLEETAKLIRMDYQLSDFLSLADELGLWCIAIPVESAAEAGGDRFGEFLDRVKASGLKVFFWAYRDETFYQEALLDRLSGRYDGVITDDPKRMRKFLMVNRDGMHCTPSALRG